MMCSVGVKSLPVVSIVPSQTTFTRSTLSALARSMAFISLTLTLLLDFYGGSTVNGNTELAAYTRANCIHNLSLILVLYCVIMA